MCAALVALTLAVSGGAKVGAASASGVGPTVGTSDGAVRGVGVPGGYTFRGLSYAAPPTGNLRWRAPHPPASWSGIRDATRYAPSCPQKPSLFEPPGPQSENCLYLNVSTRTLRRDAKRPVLVWIHGGGFTQDGALNYDATKLAADGIVVVTINYRLGALGFLAHPALASRPGGASGNYGLITSSTARVQETLRTSAATRQRDDRRQSVAAYGALSRPARAGSSSGRSCRAGVR
jgi:para-nitrobenzyl esterase